MKLCLPHWQSLRAAIDARGLTTLIAKDGSVATNQMIGSLSGQPDKETFDPLMAANLGIWGNAIDAGGLYLMGQKPDGSAYCPLCELKEHGGDPQVWITAAADDSLKRARELGLAPEAS